MDAAVSADDEFDCKEGLGKWETGWSNAKKDWCCKNGDPDTCKFDCEAGLSNWETGWSKEKKDWCCTHTDDAFCEGSNSIVVDRDTGCDNWKTGSFGPSTLQDSPEKCLDKCRGTPGCTTTNYQKVECPHKPGEQVEKGSCYVMGPSCRKGRNECWDVHVLPEHERMAMSDGFTHPNSSKPRTWCSNMDDIAKDPPQVEWSVWSCKLKCQLDNHCTGIVYQPGDCSGATSAGAKHCRLLRGPCEETFVDGCWELHNKKEDASTTSPPTTPTTPTTKQTTTSPATTSSTTRRPTPEPAQIKGTLTKDMDNEVMNLITVEDWKSLRVGDRLKICGRSADKVEISRIHAVGPKNGQWLLDEKLDFPHVKGTEVVLEGGDCPSFDEEKTLEDGTTTEELPSTVTHTTTTHHALFSLTRAVIAGSLDIFVDKQECFEIGDEISFIGKGETDIYNIVDKGSLRLHQKLVESYEAGTSVIRRHAGGNPAHCGSFEKA
jgi:hypothetical protein